MPRGKLKKTVPPPPPDEGEEILSKGEIDQLVYRTMQYGDIYRLKSMLSNLENVDVGGRVRRTNSRYVHENTVDFTLDTDFNYATKAGTDEPLSEQEIAVLDDLANKVEKDIDSIVTDICKNIYRVLEKEYEYLTSDEQVEESIRANEYDFDEEGKRGGDLQYDQLDASAQERARNWYREGALDYEWWEFVVDDWKTWLEKSGFNSPEINFSGFWSQGDGASFTCSSFDLDEFCAMLADPATKQENRL